MFHWRRTSFSILPHFSAFHVAVVHYCTPSTRKEMQPNKNNNGKTKRNWWKERSGWQGVIVLSSGFVALYWCGLYLTQHMGGPELNYWRLVCHQGKIKASARIQAHPFILTHTHTHTSVYCCCEDLNLALLLLEARKANLTKVICYEHDWTISHSIFH